MVDRLVGEQIPYVAKVDAIVDEAIQIYVRS